METETLTWGEHERRAWSLPERISVSEWAAKYRVLDARNSAEPGQWRNERTPYLMEIMDAFVDPQIEEVTVMASTQVGKSEAIMNMLAYVCDQDPGPVLLVQPREDDVFAFAHNRMRAMFHESEKLRQHIPSGRPEDLMQKSFVLDRMTIFFAGSNSPAALSGKPIRYLFLDETDKYPRFSGREASPIKLARERTRTFWNRKIFKSSSPTLETGYIFGEYQKSDKRRYFVPCPHCGTYQVLQFEQVQVPKEQRDPGRIRENRIAWYECVECKRRILDHHKPAMLLKGVWVAEGQTVKAGGIIEGEAPTTNHAGFFLNALYSNWLTFSEVIAEFFESRHVPEDLMNFLNSWLAVPWKEQGEHRSSIQILESRSDYPSGAVPGGAVVLTAGVDVQKHFFYYIIRAWAQNLRSWLVEEGELPGDDWSILDARILKRIFPVLGDEDAEGLPVALTCIDSGFRTDEVYDFVRSRPNVRAIKGAARNPQRPFWSSMVDVHPVTGERLKIGVRLWMLDTDFFKDFIFRRMALPSDDENAWSVHKDISLDYSDQVSAEQKVVVRKGRTEYEEWRPRVAGAKNHLWDAEVYAAAAAHMLKGFLKPRAEKKESSNVQILRPGPWISPRPGWLKSNERRY